MATNPSKLRVTELDFDDIKDNLKTFLKAQSQFRDYDFEGSGMSVLLDILHTTRTILDSMRICSQTKCSSIVHHYDPVRYHTQRCWDTKLVHPELQLQP